MKISVRIERMGVLTFLLDSHELHQPFQNEIHKLIQVKLYDRVSLMLSPL